jgi:DNA-binding NarL/FixJ family response regulator
MSAGRQSREEAPTVVLIDSHRLFRAGLRELLERAGIRVVGEGSTVESGVALSERLRPAVAIVDPNLPHASSHEPIRRICERAPGSRVLVLTVSCERADVAEAVLSGAHGYLLKDASSAELVAGVWAAAAGLTPVSATIGAALFEELRGGMRTAEVASDCALSAREKEVLRLVVDGKSNAAIARELVISPHTVRSHLSNILLKLHTDNRLEAAVHAVRHSIV